MTWPILFFKNRRLITKIENLYYIQLYIDGFHLQKERKLHELEIIQKYLGIMTAVG